MRMMKKMTAPLLALCLLAGCGTAARAPEAEPGEAAAYIDLVELKEAELEAEAVALSSSPAAVSTLLLPEASGKQVKENGKAVIDYSNVKDGYVMAQFTASTNNRLVVQTAGPTTTYTYNLRRGSGRRSLCRTGTGATR